MVGSQLVTIPTVPNVEHIVEFVPALANHKGAFRVDEHYNHEISLQPAVKCPICSAMMTIPHGNIKSFLQAHLTELGGESALVVLRFHHKVINPP